MQWNLGHWIYNEFINDDKNVIHPKMSKVPFETRTIKNWSFLGLPRIWGLSDKPYVKDLGVEFC